MAHECSPGAPALIQTPIGGRPGTWMERREAMAEELAKWASRLDELDVTFCIKPHSKQVMGRPEQLLWMLDRVNHPHMKVVYATAISWLSASDSRRLSARSPRARASLISRTPLERRRTTASFSREMGALIRAHAQNDGRGGISGPIVVEVSNDMFASPATTRSQRPSGCGTDSRRFSAHRTGRA